MNERKQAGIATLITLIALLVMMIAAVALIRSTGVSQTAAGNLAFRRDLANRAEVAVAKVNTLFSLGGALNGVAAKQSNLYTQNYSATTLPSTTTNSNGVPDILLSSDATFTAKFTAGDISDAANGIVVRYVIDRLCNSVGPPSTVNCPVGSLQSDTSGSAGEAKAGGGMVPVYRLSIRISGPRNTQGFFQTTFTQ